MATEQAEERRTLAVYRHAPTKKGAGRGHGSHLSAEGVALARRIGNALEPCDRVYVSPHPRTLETALAMGYAVDDTLEFTCGYVPGEFEHHAQWGWAEPHRRFAEILRAGTTLAERAAADAALWAGLVAETPSGGRALVVSHGGSIEPTLVACLPDADHAAWGGAFAHCDGVELTFAGPAGGGRFVGAIFRRASDRLMTEELY